MENQPQPDISERINQFLGETESFNKDMKLYVEQMKRQSKAFGIMEGIKFMEGDYVWAINPDQIHITTLMFNHDKMYISSRAKFNPDGTDNRMELTAENQIDIQQTHITAILYGNPFNSYFNREAKEKHWWYRTSAYRNDSWHHEEMISSISKEDLIRRWRKKYENLRDAYFENHYKNKAQEKQRRIDEAKRILEQEGQS